MRTGDIAGEIADTPAYGFAGLRVKCRALQWIQPMSIQNPEYPGLYDLLISSMIEDLAPEA